jgi:hypothetical protein
MLIFPTSVNRRTLTIVQPATTSQSIFRESWVIRHRRTLCIVHPVAIFLNRVFTKENTISSLRKSSSPFFLQEFGPLILLKTKDRFTSLMVIGMTKIMCNLLHSRPKELASYCCNCFLVTGMPDICNIMHLF